MTSIWTDQTAIITGGASGLGAATACYLRKQGLKIALLDLDEARGAQHATKLDGVFCKTDVADPESVATALGTVAATLGTPRVLINCAGIAPAAKTVSRGAAHDPVVFHKTIAINLIGSFNCASQAAAYMAGAEPLDADGSRGVIVNTASVAGYEGQIGQAAYAASKGGVIAMTLPMARDLADRGVRVCSIAPGLFLTPMLESLPEDVRKSLGAQVPFPSRLGMPGEYARMVGHILENSMLNGSVLRLDGAIRLEPR